MICMDENKTIIGLKSVYCGFYTKSDRDENKTIIGLKLRIFRTWSCMMDENKTIIGLKSTTLSTTTSSKCAMKIRL